ncbi:peptidase S9 [Bacteroidia bacterium]|nr:peptidase S9 [Bacteroidia bacterium]
MALIATSCVPNKDTAIIDKPVVSVVNGQLTPEILWAFGRLGGMAVSPDQQHIAYTVTYYDVAANKGNAEMYVMNADGSNVQRLTTTAKSESNPVWIDDYTLAYLYQGQVHIILAKGGTGKQISTFERPIEEFSLSPDRTKILYAATLDIPRTQPQLFENLDKTTGRVIEDLSYRHWDSWVDEYPHLFVADFNTQQLTVGTDLLANEPFEAPMRPFGGLEQTGWSPDSKTIAYSCRKKTGKDYAVSTNSDIYLYDLASKSTVNLTDGMPGYDMNPRFSPDGSLIAWESMERDGYEADQVRLFTLDLATQSKTYRTSHYDSDATNLLWSADGQSIYFLSPWHASVDIYKLDLATNEVVRISNGFHEYTSLDQLGNDFVGIRMTSAMPPEIFSVSPTGVEQQLSHINTDLLSQLKLGKIEERWIKTTDNKDMLVLVTYPYNYDSSKVYPALLYCGGGPQSMVGHFWSYRWNFQMMSAGGYVVVAPNRRGLPGFGKAWCEQISGDYGGQNMKDYLSAIDALSKERFVDAQRLGCTGASYGGFSVYWLAGHHNKRFKAFLAHNGMFNFEQQYLETEELWFANWDLGGPYWDKNNKIAQNSYANSPHKFVDKWDTPLCVIHSEFDYRIVASQGMAAFNAAQLRNIPSRYLYFSDENHWVLKPQNSVLWHRNFLNWFDTYLK